MILRRHPSGVTLGAWFDGEGTDRTGAHVARCRRCRRKTSEMARLRSWLRAQPFVAMAEDDDEVGGARRRWAPIALVAAVLAGFLLVPERGDPPRGTDDQIALGGPAPADPPEVPPSAPAAPAEELPGVLVPDQSPAAPAASPRPASPLSPRPTSLSETPSLSPLRLGLVVPTTGPMAREGAAIERVVRQRVVAANTAGGVAGNPVELVVVAAEDAAAVAALGSQVDALVGGFGATPPAGAPWLLPADPTISGPTVVPADLSPRAAGARLAQLLKDQGLQGPIGVVVGSGPDSAMAAGLASKAATTTVQAASDGSCTLEVIQLFQSGATAMAVAGSPQLAAECARAVTRSPWRPLFGMVVAPSAAYGGLEAVPEALGARTILALPWPTSLLAGAARFRATTDSTSYRALVSYAATELAIDVARQAGDLSLASVASGTWRSDLLDLVGTTSRSGMVVTAFLGTWLPGLL